MTREELIAQGPRAYVEIRKATKVPVASPDGVLTVIREVKPGDLIPRADWDRFPARSRRTMINAGFIHNPLTVEINPITQQVVSPPPVVRQTVSTPGVARRYDALGHLITTPLPQAEPAANAPEAVEAPVATMEPPKRKRGRPRKVRV